MEEAWHTNINELMINFHGALSAIIPFLDKVKIHSDFRGYDWDDISETLYKSLVINVIRFSKEIDEDANFPVYEMTYESYGNLNLICKDKENLTSDDHILVFLGFLTREEIFDSVEFINISTKNFTKINKICFPLNECKFIVLSKNKDGKIKQVSSFLVDAD